MQCHQINCPAYKNYHHRCWYLAGTLCQTCVEGEYAKKIDSCQQCSVYKQCSGDEIQSLAESFDAMTLSLKGNLSDLRNAESILMESVGRLAAGVAHEINTPLGIILGYAQLLLEDVAKDGQIDNDVVTIVKQTKNCSKIVADLLNFSRSGKSNIIVSLLQK